MKIIKKFKEKNKIFFFNYSKNSFFEGLYRFCAASISPLFLKFNPNFISSLFKKENFRDLHYQEKYFYDREKISLYYSLVNYGGRKVNVKKVSKLSILAVLFSIYVYIYNIPRLIKLKYFPGVGKQNYT